MSDSMRDFFGELGKRIGETAETMTSRAGDAIEIQRLKGQIRDLARGNAVDLMDLGKTIYDRYKAGEELEDSVKGICDAIKKREESIADYEKKISRIKGAAECPNCGKMVAKDMAYCPYCGKPAVHGEETEAEDPEDAAEEETAAGAAAADAQETAAQEECSDAGDARDEGEHGHSYADTVKEKVEKAADKAGEMAYKAVDKAEEMADKMADRAGAAADKAAEKISSAAEKAADKINGS